MEDLQLDDTTSLRITHGGCAHFVERYAFTIGGAPRDTADSRYWLTQGADLLRRLAVVDDRRSQIDQMATALENAAREPYAYGDVIRASELATVSLLTRRDPANRAVVLEITFDVSL